MSPRRLIIRFALPCDSYHALHHHPDSQEGPPQEGPLVDRPVRPHEDTGFWNMKLTWVAQSARRWLTVQSTLIADSMDVVSSGKTTYLEYSVASTDT